MLLPELFLFFILQVIICSSLTTENCEGYMRPIFWARGPLGHSPVISPAIFISARLYSYKKPFSSSKNVLNDIVDPPDYSSIQTMEKILSILHDAESNSDKAPARIVPKKDETSIDPAYELLGKSLFDYALIRHMNDREFFRYEHKDPQTSYNALHKRAFESYMNMENSFFQRPNINRNNTLGRYQAIALYFLEDKSHCLRRLYKDIRYVTKEFSTPPSSKRDTHLFPDIKLPQPHKFDIDNPFTIGKALNNKGKYNILSFLPNDEGFLKSFITRYQKLNGNQVIPIALLHNIMLAYELEGKLLFEVLTRASAITRDNGDSPIVLDKFLFDNESLKAVVTERSKLLSRLFSLNNYKISLSNSSLYKITDEAQVIEFMAKQFDRFFALYYRINAADADAWLNRLLAHCSMTPVVDKEASKECVDYFSDIREQSSLMTNKLRWTKR